jgi:hypothetical protein
VKQVKCRINIPTERRFLPSPCQKISAGSVIHIKNFVAPGHAPNDKFAYVIGCSPVDGYILFYLISSQDYSGTHLGNETLLIPVGTCPALAKQCWIQFFYVLHSISPSMLAEYLASGRLTVEGVLPVSYLSDARKVIENSDVLKQCEIDESLSVLPK